MNKKVSELYDELWEIAKEIKTYYDIDKVKTFAVYIWTKGDKNADPFSDEYWGENVFDIYADQIVFFDKNHKIPKEVMPIIKKIQGKLKEIENLKERS